MNVVPASANIPNFYAELEFIYHWYWLCLQLMLSQGIKFSKAGLKMREA